jgi:hypothetical protein
VHHTPRHTFASAYDDLFTWIHRFFLWIEGRSPPLRHPLTRYTLTYSDLADSQCNTLPNPSRPLYSLAGDLMQSGCHHMGQSIVTAACPRT